jgi:hypothetical protein
MILKRFIGFHFCSVAFSTVNQNTQAAPSPASDKLTALRGAKYTRCPRWKPACATFFSSILW